VLVPPNENENKLALIDGPWNCAVVSDPGPLPPVIVWPYV